MTTKRPAAPRKRALTPPAPPQATPTATNELRAALAGLVLAGMYACPACTTWTARDAVAAADELIEELGRPKLP